MKSLFNKTKASHVFNIIALIIIVVSIFIYNEFSNTRKHITHTYDNSTKNYVKDFTNNIKTMLLNSCSCKCYNSLKNDTDLRETLEKNIGLFITDRYKYIYLLDKEKIDSQTYRFLLDGSKNLNDKSEFGEPYKPLNSKIFNDIYKTKEASFYVHQKIESLWMTYITPLVVDDEVIAILVVDFSIEDFEIIDKTLDAFDSSFVLLVLFFIFIFLVIIRFSFIDKNKTLELELQHEEVRKLNSSLAQRVEDEVEKNRLKDKQMKEQSRLAQMGEMLSMIAHQWRQPLNAIAITSNNLILKCVFDNIDKDEFQSELALIDGYSQHLSSTIDDFRNFFKENKDKSFTTIDELVSSTMDIVRTSIENKNIKLIIDVDSNNKFETYQNEVKQVLLNIIKNAEDILLEREIKNPTITINSTVSSDNTSRTIIIKDNGGGIPDKIIEKIFDPYFSTKKAKEGTGLGLYMSKTIIQDHCSGSLDVSNNDGDGAIFRITL